MEGSKVETNTTLGLYNLVFLRENNCSEDFEVAYATSVKLGLDPILISDKDFQASKDEDKIYVLSSFKTDLFTILNNLSCYILGPVALLMAMKSDNTSIVRRPNPAFNLIMRDCVITFSNISKTMKKDLVSKIYYMGGQVGYSLTGASTHLITEIIGSEKYYAAVTNNIPIMLPVWIEDMIKDESVSPKLHNDPAYDKLKMPLFYGLTICISNIEPVQRRQMSNVIISNGGCYSGILQKGVVTHLISPTSEGAKFDAASLWGLKCVNPQWFDECISKKYVVQEGDFLLPPSSKDPKVLSSTLNKDNQVGESMLTSVTTKISFIDANTTSIQNATTYVQEPSIYVVNKVLENAEESSIAITSKDVEDEVKNLPEVFECLDDDNEFPVPNENHSPQSPTLIENEKTIQPQLDENKENKKLYTNPNMSPSKSKLSNEDPISNQNMEDVTIDDVESNIFNGLTFNIENFPTNFDEIKAAILKNGGKISKKPKYTIVPLTMFKQQSTLKSKREYVTLCWLQMCLEYEEILPLDGNFLFKPITIPDNVEISKPLKDCVITLSQFNSVVEQESLTSLITLLGAVSQGALSRSVQKNTGLVPTTHLICKQCEGKKFKAARAWIIKTVKVEWLYTCAISGELVPEGPFYLRDDATVLGTSSVKFEKPEPTKQSDTRVDLPQAESTSITKPDPSWRPRPVKINLEYFGLDPNNMDESFDTKILNNYKKLKRYAKDIPPDYFKPANKFRTVYLTTSNKLRKQQPTFFKIAEKLGINCQKEYNNAVTHLLHEQKASDPLALDVKWHLNTRQKTVVSPEWLYECQREGTYIDESLFPYSYNKRLSLSSHISSQKVSSPAKDHSEVEKNASQFNNQEDFDETMDETCASPDETCASPPETSTLVKTVSKSALSTQDFAKQLDILASATKAARNVYEEKKNSSQSPAIEPRHRSFPRTETQPLDIDNMRPSQQAPIIWSDQARQVPGHDLSGMTTYNEGTFIHAQKVFLLASVQNEQEPKELSEIIERLGGKALCEKQFDNAATHLVVEKLSKSEKMLSAIASGKIILHKDYITESGKAGKFLDEEKYIIGSPTFLRNKGVENPLCSTMAAVYRWHQKFSQSGEGAFSDWCVMLKAPDKKLAIFRRVLEAGGGQVVASPDLMVSSKKRIALIEKSSGYTIDDKFCKQLMENQIWCLKPEYFADYLHVYPEPNIEAYLFPLAEKFLPLIRSRPSKKQKVDL